MTASRPRILVLTNLYPGGVLPARGAFVENQVRSLRELGHQMEVLHIDGARSRLEYLKGAARLLRLASPERFDLVHAHYGLTGLIGTLQKRLPLVVTYLGSDLLWGKHRRFSLEAARRADCNIVMSRAMKESLAPLPCVVVPNGTDTNLFRPMDPDGARRALGWPQDDFLVLFPWDPSRPEKNYRLAVKASEQARALGAAGIRLMEFHGRSQEEYNLALNAADLCLLTSEWEGSPNAVRESLAVGLPVVSVPAGDAPEMLEGIEYCRVVSRDPVVLGKSVHALFRLRQEAGRPVRHDGRRRALEHSLESTAEVVSMLYDLILEGVRDAGRLQGELGLATRHPGEDAPGRESTKTGPGRDTT